jgi:magnesium transporter
MLEEESEYLPRSFDETAIPAEIVPSVGDSDPRLNRGSTREILSFVIDIDGNTHLAGTSLRILMNEINTAVLELDGDISIQENCSPLQPTIKVDKSEIDIKSARRMRLVKGLDLHNSSSAAHSTHSTHFSINTFVSVLKLRDLRRLDFNFNPNEEKSFLVRRHIVLFAMDPLRAVIMWNKVILLVPQGADSILHRLSNNLNVDKFEKQTAFEMHAIDALLRTLIDSEREIFLTLEEQISRTLQYFRNGSLLSIEIQEDMRMLKNQLSQIMNRLELCRNTLVELTEDDEEMALMNLSVLKLKPTLYRLPLSPEILATHDRVEELLETHLIDINAICSKISLLKTNIHNAEEMVSLRLDTSRNELLIANTALTVLSCGIGFGAYISGVFGMNLDQTKYLQPRENSFLIGTILSFIGGVLVFIFGYGYLKMAGILPERAKVVKPSLSVPSPRNMACFNQFFDNVSDWLSTLTTRRFPSESQRALVSYGDGNQ